MAFLPVGTGPSIAVLSYAGNPEFGVGACRELVPHVWRLMGYIVDALDELTLESRSAGPPALARFGSWDQRRCDVSFHVGRVAQHDLLRVRSSARDGSSSLK